MIQRPFLFGFLLAGLFIVTNLWHIFSRWFVQSQGLMAGFLLLVIVLLFCFLLDPYSD